MINLIEIWKSGRREDFFRERTRQEWERVWKHPETALKIIAVYLDTETNQIIVVDNRQGTGQPVKTYPDLDTAKVAVTLQGE